MLDKAEIVSGTFVLGLAPDGKGNIAVANDGTGRRLCMVVGIVAVPDDFPIKDEFTKIVVAGDNDNITLEHDTSETLPPQYQMMKIGDLLIKDIWRI